MLAEPNQASDSWFLNFRTMLGQYDLKNVQNLTYFVYFFSKTKHLYIYELNFNV